MYQRPSNTNKQENPIMELKHFGRKAFTVEAVQVTAENMEEIAEWCTGTIEEQTSRGTTERYIRVPVHRPVNEKQTKAFVGDWTLKSPTGFKVYVDRAFRNSFDEQPQTRNVFEQAAEVQAIVDEANKQIEDEPQELRTVDAPAEPACDNCGHVKPLIDLDKDRKLCRKCMKELEVEEPGTRTLLGFNEPTNLMGDG